MKKIILFIFTFALFLFFPQLVFAQTGNVEQKVEAKVISIKEEKILKDGGIVRKYQKLELEITNSEKKGQKIIVENGLIPVITTVEYEKNDEVLLSVTKDPKGKDVYFITEHIRRDGIYLLFGIFIFLTLIIGRLRGLTSIIGMFLSLLVIFYFLLPQILQGKDPIQMAVMTSFFIIPLTFFLSHGVSKKTTVAVVGTIIALIFTGVLANIFVNLSHLTGFSSDDATFLNNAKQGAIQMKGLLLSGIIIGALGVLDDISVAQAAVVFQLRSTAERKYGFWKIYSKAMSIGRDHIASMVNTLFLVYTGAAMPLLLIFANSPRSFTEIINYEMIAEEIVRTLVVSCGLIFVVPIVTFLATIVSHPDFKHAVIDIFKSLK